MRDDRRTQRVQRCDPKLMTCALNPISPRLARHGPAASGRHASEEDVQSRLLSAIAHFPPLALQTAHAFLTPLGTHLLSLGSEEEPE